MTQQEIKQKIADLEQHLFYLEMDDFAYTNGTKEYIDRDRAEIKRLKELLNDK